MALTKYKLGQLIEPCESRNSEERYTLEDVRGISTDKAFIATKANMDGVSLDAYKVVKRGDFAYVADTSRRGEKIAIAFNDGDKAVLISSIYTVFRVRRDKEDTLLSDYLFMYFNRPEFDRYARFNSWGSARETFDWAAMCEIDIELPDRGVQQSYVDVYKAMAANQADYESGLEDLKLVCDGYIEDLRRRLPVERIGPYLERHDVRNGTSGIKNVMGISTSKRFREPTSKVNKDELAGYKVCRPRQIAFVQTTHNEKVFAYALNQTEEDIVVSSVNEVFSTREDRLYPEFLCMFFNRGEFDRYARFHSWGSARETFTWGDLQEVRIPIPDIEVQRAIAKVYAAYLARRHINEQMKAQIKHICPVLIRGSLEEGGKSGHGKTTQL